MKKHKLINNCLLIIISLVLLFITKLILFPMGDYRIVLPQNYAIVRTSYEHIYIINPDGWKIIGMTVDSYYVKNNIVIGHVSVPKFNDSEGKGLPGYFILDTKSGVFKVGLTKNKWSLLLASYDLDKTSKLKKPNIMYAVLSRIKVW